MCGIAGLIAKKEIHEDRYQDFINSSKLMNHRGPDYREHVRFDNVLLVHYRLSIIDLEARSHQPFTASDPSLCTVYNGEIYNYRDLQTKFNIKTKTSSDTEVMLETYAKEGDKVIPEWNGIFSVAILDKSKKRIKLIRDRYGVKPLYIYEDDEVLLFASEAKVILDWLPNFKLNYNGLSQYMWYGNTISEETIIEGLKKIPPARIIDIDSTSGKIISDKTFWKNPGTRITNQTVEEVIENVKLKLDLAVQRQMVADVPLGVLLSGGVDSSGIVAMASKYATNKLDTYSIEYDYNIGGNGELQKAAMMAKKYNTNHHELKVEAKNIQGIFSDLVFQYDEPFADTANIPLFQLTQACSKDKRVILQGDGGDELFAGYRRYNILSWLKFWQLASSMGHRFIPHKRWAERMKRMSFILNQKDDAMRMAYFITEDVAYKDPYAVLNDPVKEKLSHLNPFQPYIEFDKKYKNEDLVQRMLYADIEILLPNTYLEKVDKASMCCSVESRVPYLDNEFSEYALQLPSSYKVRKGEKKYLLKKALGGLVPDEILYGPKKGFAVPYKQWLRKDLYDFAYQAFKTQTNNDILDGKNLLSLLETHKKGDIDYGPLLWKSLVLTHWLDRYRSKIRS